MGLNVNRKADSSVYFDACIYIAHYRQEVSAYGKPRIAAIGEMWNENSKGAVVIVTSTISLCEVLVKLLEWNLTAESDDFKNLFKFGKHKLVDVEPHIAEKAAQYRNYYFKHPLKQPTRDKPYKNLATPDAIHLA